jgi:hypothetical protein
MGDDPCPIEDGMTGTVVSCADFNWTGRDCWSQITVKWDNGRHLMLCVPPDRFEVIQ